MSVHMIWAEARNRVIGASGRLPWYLPEDLARFRTLTWGETVVMGRHTWLSLPEGRRPLPGRRNVVLTRRSDWQPQGAEIATSVEEVLERYPECWVIGGAQVYQAMLPYATHIVRTRIDLTVPGDTHAPILDPAQWRLTASPEAHISITGLRYTTSKYARVDALSGLMSSSP